MRKLLLVALVFAMATPALAQNAQYNLRDTTAVTNVTVGSAQDVGATAVASGK